LGPAIHVGNKLEIRLGNVVSVPGCEPISSLTGTTLLQNIDCKSSVIPVEDVLRLIPGARVVRAFFPAGTNGTGRFLELPAGPPPDGDKCPGSSIADFYRIMKDNARTRPQNDRSGFSDGDVCSGFDFSGCVTQRDEFHTTKDPSLRPNGDALEILDVRGRRTIDTVFNEAPVLD